MYMCAFVLGTLALDPLELWLRTCCVGAETQTLEPQQIAEGAPNYWFILVPLFLNSWTLLPLPECWVPPCWVCGARGWMQGFMLAKKALYWVSYIPSPCFNFLLLIISTPMFLLEYNLKTQILNLKVSDFLYVLLSRVSSGNYPFLWSSILSLLKKGREKLKCLICYNLWNIETFQKIKLYLK